MVSLKKNNFIIWTLNPQIRKSNVGAWSSNLWIESQLNKTQDSKRRNNLNKNEKIIFNLINKNLKTNKILDIGGGLGSFYFSLKKKISNLDYYILEVVKLVNKINKIKKKKFKEIKFVKEIPNKKFNIVLLVNSLHYINNWKSFFQKILKNQPDYIVIIDLPVVNVSTFFGYQKYYFHQIKYRFQNKNEFKSFFKNKNYKFIKNTKNIHSKVTQKKYYEKDFFKKKFFKVKSETFILINKKCEKILV